MTGIGNRDRMFAMVMVGLMVVSGVTGYFAYVAANQASAAYKTNQRVIAIVEQARGELQQVGNSAKIAGDLAKTAIDEVRVVNERSSNNTMMLANKTDRAINAAQSAVQVSKVIKDEKLPELEESARFTKDQQIPLLTMVAAKNLTTTQSVKDQLLPRIAQDAYKAMVNTDHIRTSQLPAIAKDAGAAADQATKAVNELQSGIYGLSAIKGRVEDTYTLAHQTLQNTDHIRYNQLPSIQNGINAIQADTQYIRNTQLPALAASMTGGSNETLSQIASDVSQIKTGQTSMSNQLGTIATNSQTAATQSTIAATKAAETSMAVEAIGVQLPGLQYTAEQTLEKATIAADQSTNAAGTATEIKANTEWTGQSVAYYSAWIANTMTEKHPADPLFNNFSISNSTFTTDTDGKVVIPISVATNDVPLDQVMVQYSIEGSGWTHANQWNPNATTEIYYYTSKTNSGFIFVTMIMPGPGTHSVQFKGQKVYGTSSYESSVVTITINAP